APATPLKMFPPPITMATSTPKLTIFFISWAYSAKRLGSMPYWLSPIKGSPLNFRSILLYFILRKIYLQIYYFCYSLKTLKAIYLLFFPFYFIWILTGIKNIGDSYQRFVFIN